MHELATRARTRGDSGAVVRRLAAAAELRPDLPSLAIELGRALEGAGEGERARALLTAVATRLPDDAGVLAALGKLLHRQGRRDEALARLRAATALRPQDPELRRYVERVGREGEAEGAGGDLAREHAADARALIAAEATRPPRAAAVADDGTSDAVVLLDRRVVRVHPNGLAQTFAQRLVAIRTEHGAEDNKEFYVRYTPGSEDVEIRQARVYRRGAGGALDVVEAADRDDEDLSEPWYGLYYDNRAEVVRFEGLRAGDVLEIQYVVEDVSAENQMSDYFGDLQTIAESIPKRLWEYTLLAPAGRPIYSNTPRAPRLSTNVSERGGERVYTFAARDVAAIESEPAMPGLAEVAPYLHVSTYASWDDVGAWYWRLVEEQLTPDDDLRRAAHDAVAPGASEGERVRAIHALVVTGTRYVGLEFGIHGFKPYKVTQVLARRFGDCKDKASLMVALLREVGVRSELVLVRTRQGGLVDRAPASLAIFDHAIVYVPDLDLYLDGTAEFSGTTELPVQDQGVMVLRVGPRGAHLAETPVLPSRANRVERTWRVDLAASGDATVHEDLTIAGQAAAEWREHYQTLGERAERYGRVWTARYPGARLTSVDMPRLEDRDAPVAVRAVADVPRFGLASGGGAGGVTLPLTVREADFSRTYARLSTRRQDLVIAYPWQHAEEIVYHLPAGWSVHARPAPREITAPFGRVSLEVTTEPGGIVHVRSFLDVTQARIAPADYAAFRRSWATSTLSSANGSPWVLAGARREARRAGRRRDGPIDVADVAAGVDARGVDGVRIGVRGSVGRAPRRAPGAACARGVASARRRASRRGGARLRRPPRDEAGRSARALRARATLEFLSAAGPRRRSTTTRRSSWRRRARTRAAKRAAWAALAAPVVAARIAALDDEVSPHPVARPPRMRVLALSGEARLPWPARLELARLADRVARRAGDCRRPRARRAGAWLCARGTRRGPSGPAVSPRSRRRAGRVRRCGLDVLVVASGCRLSVSTHDG